MRFVVELLLALGDADVFPYKRAHVAMEWA